MSCVKTGARIYFENYGMTVVGDAFRIGDVYIFQWNTNSLKYTGTAPEFITHEVHQICSSETWYHRNDLGMTVVPTALVTVHKD